MIDCDKVLIERDIDGTVYVLAWRDDQVVLTCGDISSVAALREVLALVPQNISFDIKAKQ
jgi:hypothetical protein